MLFSAHTHTHKNKTMSFRAYGVRAQPQCNKKCAWTHELMTALAYPAPGYLVYRTTGYAKALYYLFWTFSIFSSLQKCYNCLFDFDDRPNINFSCVIRTTYVQCVCLALGGFDTQTKERKNWRKKSIFTFIILWHVKFDIINFESECAVCCVCLCLSTSRQEQRNIGRKNKFGTKRTLKVIKKLIAASCLHHSNA